MKWYISIFMEEKAKMLQLLRNLKKYTIVLSSFKIISKNCIQLVCVKITKSYFIRWHLDCLQLGSNGPTVTHVCYANHTGNLFKDEGKNLISCTFEHEVKSTVIPVLCPQVAGVIRDRGLYKCNTGCLNKNLVQ